jgi:hypothetical protein
VPAQAMKTFEEIAQYRLLHSGTGANAQQLKARTVENNRSY